jgi:exonuclease III
MKIGTLNICIFPIISQNMIKDDKYNRVDKILSQICKENLDILCIQELFCKKMIKYIENHKLAKDYKIFYDDSYLLYNRSGLVVLSKYTIDYEKYIKYRGYNCVSKILRDPILQIIKINNNYILNAHFISSEYYPCRRKTFLKDNETNRKDVQEIFREFDKDNNTVILCGDFNCNNFYINDYSNRPYFMNEYVGKTINEEHFLSLSKNHDINVCDYIVSNRYVINTKKVTTESDHYMIISDIL